MGSLLRCCLLGATLLATACGFQSSPTAFRSLAFVANAGDDSVTVFDVDDLQVVATIDLFADHPWAIVLSEDERIAYVLNRDSNDLAIVDTATQQETGTIALSGQQPARGWIASDGFLYVAFLGSSFLARVDLGSETQVGSIAISEPASSIVENAAGGTLWLGGSAGTLMKVSLGTGTESATFDAGDPIASLAISVAGELYLGLEASPVLATFDTGTEAFGPDLPVTGGAGLDATDLAIDGLELLVVLGSALDSGGVASLARSFDPTGFALSADDDGSFDVTLPFAFSFQGGSYTDLTVSSNGVVSLEGVEESFETGVGGILGFTPNNEDLDSGSSLFSYSSRLFGDHAVFQWASSMNDADAHSNWVSLFELLLFDDGSARFDYLLSMPDAIGEDDGTSYGVGDGVAPGGLVDLRGSLGSPFGLERRSFLWDPAQPAQVSEVDFAWEGTGLHYFPGRGLPTGLALTPERLLLPVSADFDGDPIDAVMVYDRETLLPAPTDVAVGADPRAIVVAEVPIL